MANEASSDEKNNAQNRSQEERLSVPRQTSRRQTVPVTVENFPRAESDMYFAEIALKDGGFGKFSHRREPMRIDAQAVIRANRDTLYSAAVFDLDGGPTTIILPDAGDRFVSLQIVDEDHYTPAVFYDPGSYTFSKERIGTRYMLAAVRILVNPNDPDDVRDVHTLQDVIQGWQKSHGYFEVPEWDSKSQKRIRDALLVLGSTLPDTHRTFGTRDQVDPVRHLIGTAMGWGGNPEDDAFYLNITPEKNDGTTVYELTVKDVPVDGFWSISVYNANGYFEANDRGAYTLNNITARRNSDDSVTIQFGGCGSGELNCLPIMKGWNCMVRLYRPRPEILDGSWKFPEPKPSGNTSSARKARKVA
jgi:hypothetical protein